MQAMESTFRKPSQLAEGREQPEIHSNGNVSRISSQDVQPSTCSSDSELGLGEVGSKMRRLAEQNKQLQEEREQLVEEIHEYRSDLTALRFPDQCSDESIQKSLEGIHRAIDDWVFEALARSDENALYRLCRKQYHVQRQQKGHSRFHKKFIRKPNVWNLGPYPCLNHFILSKIIQWILDEEIFQRRYPLALSELQRSFFDEIEDALENAHTIRERLNINRWKSETLRVLVALPKTTTLQEKSEKNQKEVTERARHILSAWVPDPSMFAKLEGRFKRDILYPAIKLHQDIRVSSHWYYWDPPTTSKDNTPKEMLDSYQMKSIHDWGPVRRENLVGKVLGNLHPALFRLRNDGEIHSVLSKAVIVVAHPKNETRTDQQGGNETAAMISESAVKELQSTSSHIGIERQEDDESMYDTSGSESSTFESADRSRRHNIERDIPAQNARRTGTWPASPEGRSTIHRIYRVGNDTPIQSIKEQEPRQGHHEDDVTIRLISPDRGGTGRNEHLPVVAPSNHPRRESAKENRSRDQSIKRKSVAVDGNSNVATHSPPRSPAPPKESSSKGTSIFSKSKTAIMTPFLGPPRNPPPLN